MLALIGSVVLAACAQHAEPQRPDHVLTGTCDGACSYYLTCKAELHPADRSDAAQHATCVAQCGDVFSDVDTINAFESLECPAVVEFVDGVARS